MKFIGYHTEIELYPLAFNEHFAVCDEGKFYCIYSVSKGLVGIYINNADNEIKSTFAVFEKEETDSEFSKDMLIQFAKRVIPLINETIKLAFTWKMNIESQGTDNNWQ